MKAKFTQHNYRESEACARYIIYPLNGSWDHDAKTSGKDVKIFNFYNCSLGAVDQ